MPWLQKDDNVDINFIVESDDKNGVNQVSCHHEEPVTLQLDNAKPHIGNKNIEKLNKFGKTKGFSVRLSLQPPRSPDLNKLDMSVFSSLAHRSNTYKVRSKSLEDLIVNVVNEYEEYPAELLLHTYAETFAVYRAILANNGSIDYSSPHECIRQRENNGEDIVNHFVKVDIVRNAIKWLDDNK
jgi:hypothetical protein